VVLVAFSWGLRCFIRMLVCRSWAIFTVVLFVVGEAHIFIGLLPSCFPCILMFMTCGAVYVIYILTFYEVLIMLVGTAEGDVESSLCLAKLLGCLVF
jgi:hypothetical protein